MTVITATVALSPVGIVTLTLAAFAFGLVLGSFANVVIARVPRGESIVHPGSHCPSCSASVRAYDNVPVVSWLVLRGHCRDCGWTIPARYPLVELASGCVAAGLAALVFLLFGV
jgi:leader peptidase (prepilin peptidase) / N-methyltransferase